MTSIGQRTPVLTFYLLAVILSTVLLGILFAAGLNDLFFIATFGPALAAILTAALIGGGTNVRVLLRRLLIWRVGLRWWLAALFLPGLCVSVAWLLQGLTGGTALDSNRLMSIYAVIPIFLLLMLLNGIPEEIGWRGFMLPQLLSRTNALVSSLIVGFFWGVWHVPIFFVDGSFQATLGTQLGLLPGLVLWTAASIVFSIVYTWLFQYTQGSTLLAGVLHGASNAWVGYFAEGRSQPEIVTFFVWFCVVWLVIAAVLAFKYQINTL